MMDRHDRSECSGAESRPPGHRRKKTLLIAFLTVLVVLLATSVCILLPTHPGPVLDRAMEAYANHFDFLDDKPYMIVIDYDRSLFRKRLWLIERETGKVLLNAHVSHAWRSGLVTPRDFSNVPGTERSSVGSFRTAESYVGRYGYARRIKGLDRGVNDRVYERAIVFHKSLFPIYSQGCFMTVPWVNKKIVDLMQDGSFVYVHKSRLPR